LIRKLLARVTGFARAVVAKVGFDPELGGLLGPVRAPSRSHWALANAIAEASRTAPAGALPDRRFEPLVAAAAAARHALQIEPYIVQIIGALGLIDGNVVEMQTGEGKTIVAALASVWFVAQGDAVHVMTANDYLAKRDAEWMGALYRSLGVSVGYLRQDMPEDARRAAYRCDVLYATPQEIGFDYLRDGLVHSSSERVQRLFGTLLMDEADSLLVDEARAPLVVAGGAEDPSSLTAILARTVSQLAAPGHFTLGEYGVSAILTDHGAAILEKALRIASLYDDPAVFDAVSDALHAHAILHRNVDYIVRDGSVQLLDACKGRVALTQRWPAGIQAAVEAKEGLAPRAQGRVLASISVRNLVTRYSRLCGMTGTARPVAEELAETYGLRVMVIPSNRPSIRLDREDEIFASPEDRDRAVVADVCAAHLCGRPVLVGTSSVAESHHLGSLLNSAGVANEVLNACNDVEEAAIIARAGQRGAVTVSTNMAGRGTDIRLSEGVAELGGL